MENWRFIDFLTWKSRNALWECLVVWDNHTLFMSHWSHPIVPNVPTGGDQWDVSAKNFKCK